MQNIFSDTYQETPFWHHNVTMPKTNQSELPKQSDICIVGAGFTGLTVALHLLEAGKSVVIFDAMKLGQSASGKNGGMIGPSLHKLGLSGLINTHGEKKALGVLQEGINAIQYFPTFLKEQNIDCELSLNGRFNGVHNQKQLEQVERKCEEFTKLDGFKYTMVAPENVQDEIGSSHYHGGVIYNLDGSIQPYKLIAALVQKIVDLGGEIYEQTPVTEIVKTSSGHQITTSRGSIKAGQTVIATNGYSKDFAPKSLTYFSKRILPLTSAMIATQELPSKTIKKLFPKNRIHGGNHRLVQYYRPSPDGKRILFGARGDDLWDRDQYNAKNLHILMCQIFPDMQQTKIDFAWHGKVAYTFDHGPHIGQQDSLFYAMGFCGSGVTRTIYLAKKLSMQILGEENFQTEFHSLNFQTKPFYNGKPWFMPFIIKWHSFMDKMNR